MMPNLRKITISLLKLLISISAQATHIVGGEITLKSVRTHSYDINLFLYFDLINGNPQAEDNVANVAIFRKSDNQLMERISLLKKTSTAIDYTNPTCEINKLKTKKIQYTAEEPYYLDPSTYNDPAGYYIAWERCCRNNVISNINDPGGAGMVFYTEFPPQEVNGTGQVDNTPIMNNPFAEYACVGSLFQYSFKAVDIDRDSLVYSLVTPFQGHSDRSNPLPAVQSAPYDPVNWESGFSATNAVPGAPTLSINRFNGLLSVVPTAQGLYVFTVLVEEYRRGVKIGEVRRDYQLMVITCPLNEKPISKFFTADNKLYNEKDTIPLIPTVDNCFTIKFTDRDTGQVVKIAAQPVNFQSSEYGFTATSGTIVTRKDTITTQVCWNKCVDRKLDVYHLRFLISDNGCPMPMNDTLDVYFKGYPVQNNKPLIWSSLADSSVKSVRVKATVGADFSFVMYAIDPDSVDIKMYCKPEGFKLSNYDMRFQDKNGKYFVQSQFDWQPTCDYLEKRKEYKMKFYAKDPFCKYSDSSIYEVVIELQDSVRDSDFIPPNIFTPNGDGINEFFEMPDLPANLCGDEFEYIAIYNRWGVKVYQSTERRFKWDGAGIADGIYFYGLNFKKTHYKGYIQVLR